tara:strand:- start:39 stop:338 length:300 start_codon:yes stop_codon:yes gene_type:complete
MVETSFEFEDPDDEIGAKPEHLGTMFLQAKKDFLWFVHTEPKCDDNLHCKGQMKFEKGQVIEVFQVDENKNGTFDLELSCREHLLNVPKSLILFEEEFL